MSLVFTPVQVRAGPPVWPVTLAGTGISDLDRLTSGLREQSLWVVAGLPRSGRSMLLVQLVCRLAAAGVPVRFVLGRDGAAEVVARVRAGSLGRSLSQCRRDAPSGSEQWLGWPLHFDPDRSRHSTRDWDPPPGGALLIDDLDLWDDPALEVAAAARTWANHPGRIVVVAVPSHVLQRDDPAAWQTWVRLADVIVEIGPDSDGAAPLRLLSHRAGPVGTVEVRIDFERATLSTADL